MARSIGHGVGVGLGEGLSSHHNVGDRPATDGHLGTHIGKRSVKPANPV
jgi:hypothetical protein